MEQGTAPQDSAGRDALQPVIDQLVRFVHAMHALKLGARRALGVSPQQAEAALHLALSGGLTVGELAAALGVSPGWASRLADELVSDGYAVREHDPTDRRVVRLRIAPAMQARCDALQRERMAAVARAFAGATPAELDTFVRLLGRLAAEFEAMAAGQAGAVPPAVAAPETSCVEAG